MVSAIVLPGCSPDQVGLFVDAVSDLEPTVQFDMVSVSLTREGTSSRVRTTTTPVAPTSDFESGFRIAEFTDLEPGTYELRAELRLRETVVLESRQALNLTTNRGLTVRFDSGCLGVSCPGVGDASGKTLCDRGECVGASCSSAEECPTSGSCEVAVCSDGHCDVQVSPCDAGVDAMDTVDAGTPDAETPAQIERIVANHAQACAITTDGEVHCWGDGREGHFADPDERRVQLAPQLAPEFEGMQRLCFGIRHGCGVRDGQVFCWGHNDNGQAGADEPAEFTVPQRVLLGPARDVACGGQHSCAMLADESVYCWGRNHMGQIGTGGVSEREPPSLLGVPASGIFAAHPTTCLLHPTGDVRCWGSGEALGLGSPALRTDPVLHTPRPERVRRLEDVSSVSMGGSVNCAISERRVWCWGDNELGALGRGRCGDGSGEPPDRVSGLPSALMVAASPTFACALHEDRRVSCWGRSSTGRLGPGTCTASPTCGAKICPSPILVPGLTDVVQIETGGSFACALTESGEVWCWGNNAEGQLGRDSRDAWGDPEQVLFPPGL